MFTQYKAYIIAIIITVGLLASNYLTYQYVDRGWQSKWQEANVESLKSTLEEQTKQVVIQKELLTHMEKINETAKLRNETIASNLANADKSVGLLQQKLRAMSEASKSSSDSTSDIGRAAREATDRLVLSELLGHCANRYKRMAEQADRSRAAGLSCQEQYNSVRVIVNK